MVKIKVPIRVEDPLVAEQLGLRSDENVETSDERFFVAGPVAERVAVVDRDPSSGQLARPVRWLPRNGGPGGEYEVPPDEEGQLALSVFGTVLETIEMFERPDVLGHRIRWTFDRPQLLVVPRAGIWENAFYDRYSRSLQFFSFPKDGRLVHTAASRDIVAHETGHAVLDALHPALYDALTPQSLALHEAIGDLTAVGMALQSRQLQGWLLAQGKADLREENPIAALASQFGIARRGVPLRNVRNAKRLADVDDEPHALCEVLTGAVWAALVHQHNYAVESARARGHRGAGAIGFALGTTATRLTRIMFRALDYLPPAEATFSDYARAILCSDAIAVPEDRSGYRDVLRQEFVDRGIVDRADECDCTPAQDRVQVDLEAVVDSDWAAYAFVEQHRELLGIPPRVPFRLLPRDRAHRRYYRGEARPICEEVIIRVTWEQLEPRNLGGLASILVPGPLPERAVFHGTTLVLSGEHDERGYHPVLSCLTCDRAERQVAARDDELRRLVDRGQIDLAPSFDAYRRAPLAPTVFGRLADGTLRLRGVARLLHLAGDEP
jgi:hypothetical protein